ncbi:MAG: hypothetical protein ABSF71_05220 [Terriglobia bacterium]
MKKGTNRVLGLFGAQIISQFELESLRRVVGKYLPPQPLIPPSAVLPKGAEEYLRPDNPRLKELRFRYRETNGPAVNHLVWTDSHTSQIDLRYFRADNPYVWQRQDQNAEINYLLTASYVKTIDKLGLLGRLEEDGLFGAHTFRSLENLVLSRDLLDSVNEINFLEEALQISKHHKLKVLDIGAGYGRFAHRLRASLPDIEKVICTDAVATSTFISEYYLRFRGASEKAMVVPLYETEAALDRNQVYLAVNIHSFSECSFASICWWLDILSARRIPYLFLVPNSQNHGGTKLLTLEAGGANPHDFMPAVLSRGYRLVNKRPKYDAPSVQKYGVSPTYYYLFELRG